MDWFPTDDPERLRAALDATRRLPESGGWKVLERYFDTQLRVITTKLDSSTDPHEVMDLKARLVVFTQLKNWPSHFEELAKPHLTRLESKANKETEDARRNAERNVNRGY